MNNQLEQLKKKSSVEISSARNLIELEKLRIRYLGRKGELTKVLRSLKELPEKERKNIGKIANDLKIKLEREIEQKSKELKISGFSNLEKTEWIDVTAPGVKIPEGHLHPLTYFIEDVIDVFASMGYKIVEGPDVETEYYNFEALNISKDHPAREMWDTFYVERGLLLRTHTSPVQIRTMEKQKPPVKIIAPGKCYRRDDDSTHSPMFHQFEGLYVDKGITLAHLKGTLTYAMKKLLGEDVKIRFRPSYFPFTEPSIEVDISCVICGGDGRTAHGICKTCKGSKWLERLGAGMVHPQVLKNVGYNPEEVTGFAFGTGIERQVMIKHKINDIRLFFENDIRFLKQF